MNLLFENFDYDLSFNASYKKGFTKEFTEVTKNFDIKESIIMVKVHLLAFNKVVVVFMHRMISFGHLD